MSSRNPSPTKRPRTVSGDASSRDIDHGFHDTSSLQLSLANQFVQARYQAAKEALYYATWSQLPSQELHFNDSDAYERYVLISIVWPQYPVSILNTDEEDDKLDTKARALSETKAAGTRSVPALNQRSPNSPQIESSSPALSTLAPLSPLLSRIEAAQSSPLPPSSPLPKADTSSDPTSHDDVAPDEQVPRFCSTRYIDFAQVLFLAKRDQNGRYQLQDTQVGLILEIKRPLKGDDGLSHIFVAESVAEGPSKIENVLSEQVAEQAQYVMDNDQSLTQLGAIIAFGNFFHYREYQRINIHRSHWADYYTSEPSSYFPSDDSRAERPADTGFDSHEGYFPKIDGLAQHFMHNGVLHIDSPEAAHVFELIRKRIKILHLLLFQNVGRNIDDDDADALEPEY